MAKILLADDSGHAQRMGAKILAEEGHEVVTASNGQAAIKELQEWIPDLVIADIFMPGKNGYEVCQFVKSNPQMQHVPVLLLIGAMEPYDPDEGRKVRANGIITKPLKPTELASTVQQLLAAAPKPAPPPAAPAVETVEATLETEAALEEVLEPEAATGETGYPEKLEIPEELGAQSLSAFGDLLEAPETAPEPATALEETPLSERAVAEEWPSLGAPEPTPLVAAEPALGWEQPTVESEAGSGLMMQQPESPVSSPWEIQTGETLQELVPEAPAPEPSLQWTAEPAPVTSQDEKLFEQATPDWGSLTQMVAAEAEAPLAEAVAATLPPEAFQSPPLYPTPAEPTEAAAAPVAEPAPLDPARLEQLVRQSLDELMPEIVGRVTQAVQTAIQKDSESLTP